jgi:hypothetical protein
MKSLLRTITRVVIRRGVQGDGFWVWAGVALVLLRTMVRLTAPRGRQR